MPKKVRQRPKFGGNPYQRTLTRTNYWKRDRKTPNAYYWNHDSEEDLSLLPRKAVRVDPPELVYDPQGGYHPAPRGGGSGVQPQGEKQTIAFFPPLSPNSEQAMADRFKDYGGFSPLVTSFEDASGKRGVTTASGDQYELGGVYGAMHVFHHKLPDPDFIVDQYGSNAASNSTIPFPPLPPSGRITVDRARLRKWSGTRKGFSPTQAGAMGNLSANAVAVKAGVSATGEYHWLHLFAFTMGGINNRNPNEPNNLIVGTLEANMLHEKIEAALKSLVDQTKKEAYVEYAVNISDPGRLPYDLDWHVATEVQWRIMFENMVVFEHTIELLSHNPPRKYEKPFVSDYLQYLYEKDPGASMAAAT